MTFLIFKTSSCNPLKFLLNISISQYTHIFTIIHGWETTKRLEITIKPLTQRKKQNKNYSWCKFRLKKAIHRHFNLSFFLLRLRNRRLSLKFNRNHIWCRPHAFRFCSLPNLNHFNMSGKKTSIYRLYLRLS